MKNLTFRTRCTSYTDNGPACHKCRGTLYGYEPHADETITATMADYAGDILALVMPMRAGR